MDSESIRNLDRTIKQDYLKRMILVAALARAAASCTVHYSLVKLGQGLVCDLKGKGERWRI